MILTKEPPNNVCSGRVGRFACAIYKHFPRFEFFLLPGRVHARPSPEGKSAIPFGAIILGDNDANRWTFETIGGTNILSNCQRYS
ncbi:MAG: hypothetical protein HZB50_10290 [Chloroflexi bacterium]|nr:hypothetical protein [Chloroflexota bacterium]